MRTLRLANIQMCILVLSLLSACGGGGGGGSAAPQPGTAVVTLATALNGTIPAGTTITGYDITLNLPAGVTVKSTSQPTETDTGVVVASGAATGSSIAAVYVAATGTTPGKVRILIANANGMTAGEFAKVTCDVDAGVNLTSSSFTQPSFTATGLDASNPAGDSTVDLTAELSLTATAVMQ